MRTRDSCRCFKCSSWCPLLTGIGEESMTIVTLCARWFTLQVSMRRVDGVMLRSVRVGFFWTVIAPGRKLQGAPQNATYPSAGPQDNDHYSTLLRLTRVANGASEIVNLRHPFRTQPIFGIDSCAQIPVQKKEVCRAQRQ